MDLVRVSREFELSEFYCSPKMEAKENPSCLIPHLFVVFTWQIENSVTALRHACGPIRRPKKIDEQRAEQEQVRSVFDTSYLLRNNTSVFLNFR